MPRLTPLCRLPALGLIVGLAAVAPLQVRADDVRADTAPLVLYGAQHEQMIELVIAAFKKDTGLDVKMRVGEAPAIANQIATEGDASPADIFFTENSPELVLLDEKGLLAKVDASTLAKVPAQDSAADGTWVGVLSRENVLAYNPSLIAADALPASLMDLAKPEWKGKVAIAPTDADFLPLVSAVETLKGHQAALDWLKGLKANAQVFDDDEGVVAAVNRGAAATGIINSYYWARLHTEFGDKGTHSAVYHFKNKDVGALINVSGAAVLKSSKHQANAQRFLAFLVSKPVQEMLAKGSVDFEYPLAAGVAANPLLKPYSELQPPDIAPAKLGDDQGSAKLLREAGLL